MEGTVCLRRILPAVIPAAYLLLISVITGTVSYKPLTVPTKRVVERSGVGDS